MQPFDLDLRTRVVFGEGVFERLGALTSELGSSQTLLVADPGLVASGHADEATAELRRAGIAVSLFQDFESDPTTEMVERGAHVATSLSVDSIVGLGGGSSLDCAKGINFLLTNGGRMQDYWGFGKASRPLLPMVGVPTTAGTGSEAQSYALISDATTHVKMACGDPTAAFRVAILDPMLTLSQPPHVTAVAGYDAISHAVESYVTSGRTSVSQMFAREAWRLLDGHYERVLDHPLDREARAAMQLGAYYAGVSIEHSMLGGAHACANPLTAHCGLTHGVAIGLVLPHVVRWNSPVSASDYGELLRASGHAAADVRAGSILAARLDRLGRAGRLPSCLRAAGVRRGDLAPLADAAAEQWTGRFNPQPFHRDAALEIYRCAF